MNLLHRQRAWAAGLASMLLASMLLTGAAWAQPPGVPLMKPALSASAPAAALAPAAAPPGPMTPRTIAWDALVPAGWDPFKDFKSLDLAGLNDGDPRADALLKKMRQAWDNAPVNAELVGRNVRIPGFVVPLEEGRDGLTEFLLVPYFGACVHSPPPPSNQIIHVLPRSAARGLRSMDTVWVTGVLKTVQADTYMGAASWRVEATTVAPYTSNPETKRP
jgi:hypothetical protein